MAVTRDLRVTVIVILSCLALASIASEVSSQSSQLQVTPPHLPSSIKQVPKTFGTSVVVNVNSTNPIINVTLYIRDVPSPPPANLNDLSLYNKTAMIPGPIKGNNHTFSYGMPRLPDQTEVWGLAKAFDTKDNVVNSSAQPTYIYLVTTPKPDAWVSMSFYPWDVNPKFLNMTGYISVTLWNSITYAPITIADNTGNITYVRHQTSESTWDAQHKFVLSGYRGLPQLFPFDNYTFTYDANLEYAPRIRQVTVNQIVFNTTGTHSGVVTFSPRSLKQAADDSVWTITSSVEFLQNTTKDSYPQVIITIHLDRQPEQVNYLILGPILALYAFLGISVLLRKESDITNRLFVYLSIFLFVFAFLPFINSLSTVPFVLGFTMAERLGIALVPSTVILAIVSIVGWMFRRRWIRIVADVSGVVAATYFLWLVVQFQFSRYVPSGGNFVIERTTYDLVQLPGNYGWFVLLALTTGAMVIFVGAILASMLGPRRADALKKAIFGHA